MSKPGAERLYRMLARNHELAEHIDGDEFPLASLLALQQFQQERIAQSYSDLMEDPGYRPAVDFFLTELYGGLDFRERDQDMSKVMPLMTHFLNDRTLSTMSEAFELQAISLEFDIAMAGNLNERGVRNLDMPQYCETYRAVDDRPGRERQILLIRELGHDLKRLVRKPFVNMLVRLLRGPAHAAGFGKLQEFLEHGLESFRALDDVPYFVETIYQREWRAMEGMFTGVEKPFGF
jgi:hypothetical protein